MPVELVEAFRPEPAVLLDPLDGSLERLWLEMAGSELCIAATRGEVGSAEHFELVLGHLGRSTLKQVTAVALAPAPPERTVDNEVAGGQGSYGLSMLRFCMRLHALHGNAVMQALHTDAPIMRLAR